MRVDFVHDSGGVKSSYPDIRSVQIPLVAPDDVQYTIIILDADDSLDVIINNPDGSREAIWSLVKAPE